MCAYTSISTLLTFIHTYISSTYLISLCISLNCIDWASLDCSVCSKLFLVCITLSVCMCTYMIACMYVFMYVCSQHHTIPVLPTVFDQEEVL